jgi:hypothetical protein
MRVHRQSPLKFNYNEKRDILTEGDRHGHDALAVACPYCQQGAGHACKQGGRLMSLLSVHVERQEAAL